MLRYKLILITILLCLFSINSYATDIFPGCKGFGCVTEGPYAGLTTLASGSEIVIVDTNTITRADGWVGIVAGDTIELSGTSDNNDTLFMVDSVSGTSLDTVGTKLSAEDAQSDVTVYERPTIIVINSAVWDETQDTFSWSDFAAGEKDTRSSGAIPVVETTLKKAINWNHSQKFIFFELAGDFTASTDATPGTSEAGLDIELYGYDSIWIAGQSAPSPGTRIKGANFLQQGSDVVMQHVRFSQGQIGATAKCGGTASLALGHSGYPRQVQPHRVHVDHISAKWGTDETLSISSSSSGSDVSIQNSIIGEGMNEAGVCAESKGGAALFYMTTSNISVIDNLIANTTTRSPQIQHGGGSLLFANNLMFDTREPRVWAGDSNSMYVDFVGNVVRDDSEADRTATGEQLYDYFAWFEMEESCLTGSKFYFIDNITDHGGGSVTTQADYSDWAEVRVRDAWQACFTDPDTGADVYNAYGQSSASFTYPSGWTSRGSSTVYANLITNGKVGAWPSARDDADTRIMSEVAARTSALDYSDQPQAADLDWGTLTANTQLIDAGSNPVPSDPHGDDDSDGYTNLEEWLFDLSAIAEGDSVDPQNIIPADNATDVGITASATAYLSPLIDSVDIWVDTGACDGTPDGAADSDDDADGTYDMSTLTINTDYCLTYRSNYNATTGDYIQNDFRTTGGPPAPPAGLATCLYNSLGLTGSYDDQGAPVGE